MYFSAESFRTGQGHRFAGDAFKFKKRAEFFVGVHNEALSVIAVRIRNEDCLSVGINRCDAAPTPTGAAEIVSHNFPVM